MRKIGGSRSLSVCLQMVCFTLGPFILYFSLLPNLNKMSSFHLLCPVHHILPPFRPSAMDPSSPACLYHMKLCVKTNHSFFKLFFSDSWSQFRKYWFVCIIMQHMIASVLYLSNLNARGSSGSQAFMLIHSLAFLFFLSFQCLPSCFLFANTYPPGESAVRMSYYSNSVLLPLYGENIGVVSDYKYAHCLYF